MNHESRSDRGRIAETRGTHAAKSGSGNEREAGREENQAQGHRPDHPGFAQRLERQPRSSPARPRTPTSTSRLAKTCSNPRTSGAADVRWPSVVVTLHARVLSGPTAIVTASGSLSETSAVITMKLSSFTRTPAMAPP